MRLLQFLNEKEQKGTYAGVRFSPTTVENLSKFIEDNNIPNPVPPSKFHTTLLYSRKHLPNFKPKGNLDKPIYGKPKKLEAWNTRDGKNALVLTFKCKALEDRHSELMDQHDATYDFPTYKTHVTLSYDIGDDFSIDSISASSIDELEIDKEYGEDLNLNWAKENTGKED